eukprot:972950_1
MSSTPQLLHGGFSAVPSVSSIGELGSILEGEDRPPPMTKESKSVVAAYFKPSRPTAQKKSTISKGVRSRPQTESKAEPKAHPNSRQTSGKSPTQAEPESPNFASSEGKTPRVEQQKSHIEATHIDSGQTREQPCQSPNSQSVIQQHPKNRKPRKALQA